MNTTKPPNFVIFLTDDQGYGDLSCMGCTEFETPNLDRLAAEGVRFTEWYSNAPVCSPSRASLLTGRYPGRAGVRGILAGHRGVSGLPPSVPTLASALRDLGYRTAMSGKWHLGVAEPSRPHRHGFDDWFGFLAGCIDYYSHIFYWGMNRGGPGNTPTHDLWDNNREIWRNGEYFTDLVTARAVRQVREAAGDDRPFFLFVAYNAPHYPMHAPARYLDRFPRLAPDRRIMAAMLSAMDDGVGAVVEELERQDLHENTCIFFTSDNGPSRETRNWLDGRQDPYYGGCAGALKGHKSSLYEGGIRMPALMSWPARIPAGRVVDGPAASMDIFPALIFHCRDMQGVGGELRPGIVHRLDRDTSGAMVAAKNEKAMAGLIRQFRSHTVRKEYLALVAGRPVPERGTVERPVGRSPHDRKKMSATAPRGRWAVTHYRVVESFAEASFLRVRIETGRTHQIRVHLAHLGHPVLGDRQYGGKGARAVADVPRQMLHAELLGLDHPCSGIPLLLTAPMPEDMRAVLRELRGE